MADAKPLLLINDEQAEAGEPDVGRQQAVGADHHVDRSVGQPLRYHPGFSGGQEAAQHLDAYRVRGEAVPERLAVLLGQQGGRDQHGGLATVLHGLEHGAHRHLGLPEADVTAHQTIHGYRPLHIGLDLLDGPQLVGRLLEWEGLFELSLPRGVLSEGVALGGHPLLVEHHQFLGDLGHLGPHPGPGLLPVRPTHAAEGRDLSARVGADGVDLVGWEIEPVVAPVLEQQVVAFDAAHRPGSEAAEAGHPMVLMDDVVAGRQILEHPDGRPSAGPGPSPGPSATGELTLGDECQPGAGQDEAPLDGCHDQRCTGREPEIFPLQLGTRTKDLDLGLEEPARQLVGAPLPVGSHHHPVTVGQQASKPSSRPLWVFGNHGHCDITAPTGSLNGLHAGPVRYGVHGPDRGTGVD